MAMRSDRVCSLRGGSLPATKGARECYLGRCFFLLKKFFIIDTFRKMGGGVTKLFASRETVFAPFYFSSLTDGQDSSRAGSYRRIILTLWYQTMLVGGGLLWISQINFKSSPSLRVSSTYPTARCASTSGASVTKNDGSTK